MLSRCSDKRVMMYLWRCDDIGKALNGYVGDAVPHPCGSRLTGSEQVSRSAESGSRLCHALDHTKVAIFFLVISLYVLQINLHVFRKGK